MDHASRPAWVLPVTPPARPPECRCRACAHARDSARCLPGCRAVACLPACRWHVACIAPQFPIVPHAVWDEACSIRAAVVQHRPSAPRLPSLAMLQTARWLPRTARCTTLRPRPTRWRRCWACRAVNPSCCAAARRAGLRACRLGATGRLPRRCCVPTCGTGRGATRTWPRRTAGCSRGCCRGCRCVRLCVGGEGANVCCAAFAYGSAAD